MLKSVRPSLEAGSIDHNEITEHIEEVNSVDGNYRLGNIINVDDMGFFFELLLRRRHIMPLGSGKTVRGTKDVAAKYRLALYVCTTPSGSVKVPTAIVADDKILAASKARR